MRDRLPTMTKHTVSCCYEATRVLQVAISADSPDGRRVTPPPEGAMTLIRRQGDSVQGFRSDPVKMAEVWEPTRMCC